MKRLKKYLIAIISLIFFVTTVNAQDLTYVKGEFSSIEPVEVNVDKSKFTLEYAEENNGIKITEGSGLTLFSPGNTMKGSVIFGKAIGYNKKLSANKKVIVNGQINLTFKEAAYDADGTRYDLHLDIDNIELKANQKTSKPITLIGTIKNSTNTLGYTIYSSKSDGDSDMAVGTKLQTNLYITKVGTNERVSKHFGIKYSDIDRPDRLNNDKYSSQYAEGVILIDGIINPVILNKTTAIKVEDTTYGANTRYRGTGAGSTFDPKTSIVYLADSASYKYIWTGSMCATSIEFMDTNVVTTGTYGSYPNNVKISETDNEVLWKENKKVVMTPDRGYEIDEITIDGKTIKYENANNSEEVNIVVDGVTYKFKEDKTKRTVTYIFDAVKETHDIKVSVKLGNYKIDTDAENAEIDPEVEIPGGNDVTINYACKDGYYLKEILVDGKRISMQENVKSYEFKEVSENHKIHVSCSNNPTYTINYLDKETNENIKDSKILEVEIDKKIESKDEVVDIENYTYDSADKESIIVGAGVNEINLYYVKKENTVTVKYLDEDAKEEILEEVKTTGKIGDEYTTEQKEVEGYTFKKVEGETKGKYKDEAIEVIYYYEKNVEVPDTGISMTYPMIFGTILIGISLIGIRKRKSN